MFKERQTIFLNESCDKCPAPGKHAAIKGNSMLTLCAHCAREHENNLLAKNFSILPATYKFTTTTETR